jgi:hypothetical protein
MKKNEMPWIVEAPKTPAPRPGMNWVTRTSEGRRYVGQGIASLTEAVKTLGVEKVTALANRALGIEEKAEISALLKSGKYAAAQETVFKWVPEAKRTRQPRPAPEVTVKAGKDGKVSLEALKAELAAKGITLNIEA